MMTLVCTGKQVSVYWLKQKGLKLHKTTALLIV